MAQTTDVPTNLIEKHHWKTDGWLAGNGLRETGTDLGTGDVLPAGPAQR